jgi:hypothetical protein
MSRASKGTLILALSLREKEPPAQTAEIPSCHPELARPERSRMGETANSRERQRGNAQTKKAKEEVLRSAENDNNGTLSLKQN